MAIEAIHKLEPHRTMYLRGFDRRGAAASLNNASATGFTVSGVWSDQADFVVHVIHDADDQFGHLFTTRYLPDFSLSGVTLDYDVVMTNGMSPVSRKYPSVPWGSLSYITKTETPGTLSLLPMATAAPGMAAASATYTVNGATTAFDRVQLIYLSNLGYDYTVPGGLIGHATYFFQAFGTTATITVNSTPYVYTVTNPAGETGAVIAAGVAAAAGADPLVIFTVATNVISFVSRVNTGVTANVSGYLLWLITDPPDAYIAKQFVAQINGTNWNLIGPTIALMAAQSGASFTVYAARYGTVNTAGTAVTFAGGQNFLGSHNGDPIQIGGTWYTIATVNSPASITLTGTAGTQTGAAYLAPGAGRDGNSVALMELHLTGTSYLTPAGASKLTGGADPTSMHFHVDFTARGIDSVRQLWLTFAPALKYDSGGVNPALVAFAAVEWSAVFTNWTLVDPNAVLPLKIAGPGSTTLGSRDGWVNYAGTGWSEQGGFYFAGFARMSATAGDQVSAQYSCQHPHNLYLGTALTSGGGKFTVALDGVAVSTIDTYADAGSPIAGRRLIAIGVAAGMHAVTFTVSAAHNAASNGYNCWFDFLQAAVLSDVQDPATIFLKVNAACDYDTPQTYGLSPSRAFSNLTRMGFAGDIDFYAGVFFANKRIRAGGNFHAAIVTIASATPGDTMFLQVGGFSYGDGLGTAFGASVFPADTVDTLAQRFVNAINTLFVGIRAARTATGTVTITTLSPVAGFTLFRSGTAISFTGDIGLGNEGVWQIDSAQASPLNRAFKDYLADFCALVQAVGQTVTVAFSQELLAPPDLNTAAGAWGQRFADGTQVLTATGFGSWGSGVVEVVTGSAPIAIQQTGHGYITGNTVHLASAIASGVWMVTVVDADNYQLTKLTSGGYTPGAGDAAFIELQTTQCNFNAATMTAYVTNCYLQAAGILNAAGLVPWLQFGEVGWWFFSRVTNAAIGYASYTSPIGIGTQKPHGLSTGQGVIIAGVRGNAAANGASIVSVVDATHFTLNGSAGNGNYVAGTGTVSGGGMAYYDAYTASLRTLGAFYTQDDAPASGDVAFLAGQIRTHIDAVRTAVLAAYAGAKFELLYPYDVNFPQAYSTNDLPYPQGGRLNAAVNLPPAYLAQAGSGLDRLKMEALSWGATYRNLANAQATIAFPPKPVAGAGGWPLSKTAYLIPIFNGGCPWPAEYVAAINAGTPLVNFWAVDHLTLLSWPIQPLPTAARGASLT
jgi:hypothetical protein